MTVNLSIKGVPNALAERLRARAERNHRSLQGELMAIIERAAAETETPPEASISATAPRRRLVSQRQGHVSIEQIAAEHLARYPEPFQGLPRAVDIIRKDRDSR
jgi:plasmid stability protein